MLPDSIARRTFLSRGGIGLGAMALGSLLDGGPARGERAAPGAAIDPLPIVPMAKRIIWLYMAGGMSHLDTFDFKPKLVEMHGQPMPESITQGQQIAQLQGQKLN